MGNKRRQTSGDFFTYLSWRGDISFDVSGFNDVDALILSQLSYLRLKGVVPEDFGNSVTLSQAAKKFESMPDIKGRKDLGMLINPLTNDLFKACGQCERFASIKLCGFSESYDSQTEKQFAAVTFEAGNKIFVAFRGTDDTIIGWKEDFNLAFMQEVPAQHEAVSYLRAVLSEKNFAGKEFYAGGHSKGGNLAICASARVNSEFPDSIKKIWNFDGPGFSLQTLQSRDFSAIKQKVLSVYPQMSMIGMLFHHFDGYKVAASTNKFVMQHDPFSWQLRANDFELMESLEDGSEIFFKSFNRWFERLKPEQREAFVETLFEVLLASEAKTNSELAKNGFKSAGRILKAFVELDSEIRDEALKMAVQFIGITGHEIKDFLL